jgi:hypothetical protein
MTRGQGGPMDLRLTTPDIIVAALERLEDAYADASG